MATKKWARAVWIEGNQEEEGVIPSKWIEGNNVRWPFGVSAIRALKDNRLPDEKWFSFALLKVKFQSDDKQECEDYNLTTTAEVSEPETDEEVAKRKPKKKRFPDYITDQGEITTVVASGEGVQNTGSSCGINARKSLEISSKESSGESSEDDLPKAPQKIFEGNKISKLKRKMPSSPRRKTWISSDSSEDEQLCNQYLSSESDSSFSDSPCVPKKRANSLSTESVSRKKAKASSLSRDKQNTKYTKEPSSKNRYYETPKASGRPEGACSLSYYETPKGSGRTESTVLKRKAPGSNKKQDFPMTEERFQRRVLFLLTEIRDRFNRQTSGDHSFPMNSDFEINQMNTIEEFKEFEEQLDEGQQASLKKLLTKIGGMKPVDLIKKAMLRAMSNGLMSKMNLKGKKEKFPFAGTKLCRIIVETVMAAYNVTQTFVMDEIAKFLKYAPERAGGGGRKKQN